MRLGNKGSISFSNILVEEAGEYRLDIGYFLNGQDGLLDILINGQAKTIRIPRANWCFEGTASLISTIISLEKGQNNLSFSSSGTPPLLDYFLIDIRRPVPISFDVSYLRLQTGTQAELTISTPSPLPADESFSLVVDGLSDNQYSFSETNLTIQAGTQRTSTTFTSIGDPGDGSIGLTNLSEFLIKGADSLCSVRIVEGGETLYVSSIDGDDTNTGLTSSSPLKTIDQINATALLPGDSILFRRGDKFIGELRPNGSGTEELPIVISAYGEGNLPVINGADSENGSYRAAIFIENQDHIELSYLKITNERTVSREGVEDDRAYGIHVLNSGNRSLNHFRINNITVEDIYAVELDPEGNFNQIEVDGIFFEVIRNGVDELPRTINDIIVENCYITRTGKFGLRFGHRNQFGTESLRRISNVIVRNNHFFETGGSAILPARVYNCLIEDNVFEFPGSSVDFRMTGRGSALWFFDSKNGIVQRNISRSARGPQDSYGYHIDHSNENIIYQYNYSEDAEGGFVEVLGENKNVGYRFNISVNDGLRANARTFWMNGYVGENLRPIPNEDVYIYNNSIYLGKDQDTDIYLEEGAMGIFNNIIYADDEAIIGEEIFIDEAEGEIFNHNNLYFGDVNDEFVARDTAATVGDPKYVFAGDLNSESYKLAKGSAAENGSDSSYPKLRFPMAGKGIFKDITEDPKFDYFGNPIDINDNYHMGAFSGELGEEFIRAVVSLVIQDRSLTPGKASKIIARLNKKTEREETVGISVSTEIFGFYNLSEDRISIPENSDSGEITLTSNKNNDQLQEDLVGSISLIDPSNGLTLGDDITADITLANVREALSATGIENLNLYPNPVHKHFSINIKDDVSQARAISTFGLVYELNQAHQNVFDVGSLAAGTYIISLRTKKGKIYYGKIIKK